MPTPIPRPQPGDHDPYYDRYVSLVPEGDVLALLRDQLEETRSLLVGLTDEQAAHRYAPGKWSVKEVAGHVTDTERVFAYRALRAARGDATPLPGFEQDDFVAHGGFDGRSLGSLFEELAAVRSASLALFQSFDAEALARRGTASGAGFAVRAIPFILAGHERHHLRILRERYLT